MNHCPVYTRVGGHSYGTAYPGPIGSIISPHLLGLAATRDLPTASSLCGACGEVCPVGIPIPEMLMHLREAARNRDSGLSQPLQGQGSARTGMEALTWKIWRLLYTNSRLYRSFVWLATRLRWLTPGYQAGWTRSRAPLKPAPLSLRDLLAQREAKRPRESGPP
jgi:L-lactate dehydrogenase complex protein LldF